MYIYCILTFIYSANVDRCCMYLSALVHIHAALHVNKKELPCGYSFLLLARGQLYWRIQRFSALLKGIFDAVCHGKGRR